MICHQWKAHSHHCMSRNSCLARWGRSADSHHCCFGTHRCLDRICHLSQIERSLTCRSRYESLLYWCKRADTHHCWYHIHCRLQEKNIAVSHYDYCTIIYCEHSWLLRLSEYRSSPNSYLKRCSYLCMTCHHRLECIQRCRNMWSCLLVCWGSFGHNHECSCCTHQHLQSEQACHLVKAMVEAAYGRGLHFKMWQFSPEHDLPSVEFESS